MKILLVNVNTSTAATDAMVAAGRRTADPSTEIVGVTPEFGSTGVDSNTQSLLAAVAVMAAVTAYTAPFDAVVLAGSESTVGRPSRSCWRFLSSTSRRPRCTSR